MLWSLFGGFIALIAILAVAVYRASQDNKALLGRAERSLNQLKYDALLFEANAKADSRYLNRDSRG